MNYKGKLYGKIGKKYFDTSHTSDDYDNLTKRVDELEKELIKQTRKYEIYNK